MKKMKFNDWCDEVRNTMQITDSELDRFMLWDKVCLTRRPEVDRDNFDAVCTEHGMRKDESADEFFERSFGRAEANRIEELLSITEVVWA